MASVRLLVLFLAWCLAAMSCKQFSEAPGQAGTSSEEIDVQMTIRTALTEAQDVDAAAIRIELDADVVLLSR